MIHSIRKLTIAALAAATLALAPMSLGTANADDDGRRGRYGWRGDRGWRGDNWGRRNWGGYRYRPYYGGWNRPRYYRPYYYQPYYYQPYYYQPYPYGSRYYYGWGVRTPYFGVQVW